MISILCLLIVSLLGTLSFGIGFLFGRRSPRGEMRVPVQPDPTAPVQQLSVTVPYRYLLTGYRVTAVIMRKE